jgi:NADH-quinone oxidoreductase subunit A
LSEYLYVGFFLVFGVLMVLVTFALNWALRPTRKEPGKYLTYECGNLTAEQSSYVPVNVRYYLLALLFVLFDVEVIFFFPLALLLREQGLAVFAYVEMVIFVSVLALGLAYAWRKGVLKWV